MPTLLVTRRMHPDLAARVTARVAGRRHVPGSQPGRGWRNPAVIGAARVAFAVGMVAICALVTVRQRQKADAFEAARAKVLGAAQAKAAMLTEADLSGEARIESWLQRTAVAYEGDFVAQSMRPAGALDAALDQKSAVYVRGTLEQLRTASGIAQAASASVRDPFLTCLLAPPATRSETALLDKVHRAYAGEAPPHAATIRRLRDVQLGLPFLVPVFRAKVVDAASWEELGALRQAWERAPIDAATAGLKADLLVFAVDEEADADAPGPTELDGERPHAVRVALVDLRTSEVLVRLRERADPSAFSAEKRPLYASGLDSCALAYDVRAAVTRAL